MFILSIQGIFNWHQLKRSMLIDAYYLALLEKNIVYIMLFLSRLSFSCDWKPRTFRRFSSGKVEDATSLEYLCTKERVDAKAFSQYTMSTLEEQHPDRI